MEERDDFAMESPTGTVSPGRVPVCLTWQVYVIVCQESVSILYRANGLISTNKISCSHLI